MTFLSARLEVFVCIDRTVRLDRFVADKDTVNRLYEIEDIGVEVLLCADDSLRQSYDLNFIEMDDLYRIDVRK